MKKDFEKNASELNLIKEQKEKLAHELQVGRVKWMWLNRLYVCMHTPPTCISTKYMYHFLTFS